MKYIKEEKIKNLQYNKNNIFVVLDFDRTITSNESEDSWAATSNKEIMGEEINFKMDELYKVYRPIEIDYKMPIKEKEKNMEKWYGDCMDLYYKYNLTKEKLLQSVGKSKLIFRRGAKEFLNKCHQENIPVIIISAGIGNVIEQFLKTSNCYFDNTYIISNFITFDENGNMKKFDNTKMIHSMNKTIKNHLPKDIQEKIKDKKYRILVGDLIEDEKMVEQSDWDSTLKIAFLNNNIEDNLEKYKEHFDIVLTNEDANFGTLGTLQIVERSVL